MRRRARPRRALRRRVGPVGRPAAAARRGAWSRTRVRVGTDADAARRCAARLRGTAGRRCVGRARGLRRARVHLHLRHACSRRAHRGDGCTRGLARLDAARVDRRAAGLGLRPNLVVGCDARRTATRLGAAGLGATGLSTAGLGRGHLGPRGRRSRGHLGVASHVRRRAARLLVAAGQRRRLDVAIACRDDRRSPTTATTTTGIRLGRRTSTSGPAGICVGSVARAPVMRRSTVGVVAVMTDAAPVPTSPVVTDAPAIGDPRIVVVPHVDERHGRPVVVRPRVPVGIPEHERAVDIVVPAPGPVDAWEGLDRLGVRVHVGDDDDLLATRQRLVSDGLDRIGPRRRTVILILHVDVRVLDVRLGQVADLVGRLLVGRGRWGVGRRLGGPLVRARATRERNQGKQSNADQTDA